MTFIKFLARKLAGLPTTDREEVLEAMHYSPSESAILSSGFLAESSYDLASKELDLHTYGAISPKLGRADCMTSAELEEAAAEIYQQINSYHPS